MKGTIVLAAALAATASTASAQTAAPRTEAAIRQQVRMMETVLTGAVRNGAETLARSMQARDPGSVVVTGTARARGIVLDGYGVFFDVDVPMMKQSVVWSMLTLQREEQIKELRHQLANAPDSPARRVAEQQLRVLERSAVPMAQPAAPEGVAVAATVKEAEAAPEPKDPNEQYTEAVKGALIDAMLDYHGLTIGDGEWLIVAARDSEGPLTPGAVDDASTIVLRVKGGDLSAYRMKQISRDEARKRVEVREN
ncbi:MAG: hypothetical protein HOQ29_13095 [Acidobacteria bacterium]|nr:hypothetical protein [Acidobacteriota bacterium]